MEKAGFLLTLHKKIRLAVFLLSACIHATGCGQQKPGRGAEEIDPAVKAKAATLQPGKDPVPEQIFAFRNETRSAYNNRQFPELEKIAAELRRDKAVFANGSWKIFQFYNSFDLRDDELETMWALYKRIHEEWIAAFPESITARVAFADFMVGHAWQARGLGCADTVTAAAGRLFSERLGAARTILEDARKLPEKDPFWWLAALKVAKGQGWPKPEYDTLMEQAKTFEPKFWACDTERAFSLLPRWYGREGDWEAYAEAAAARPEGLGAEVYARIVISLRGSCDKIFEETKASWPKTREGLIVLLQKYPESIELASQASFPAAMNDDRALAQEMFARIGETYLPGVWRKPDRFIRVRNWTRTGKW